MTGKGGKVKGDSGMVARRSKGEKVTLMEGREEQKGMGYDRKGKEPAREREI